MISVVEYRKNKDDSSQAEPHFICKCKQRFFPIAFINCSPSRIELWSRYVFVFCSVNFSDNVSPSNRKDN